MTFNEAVVTCFKKYATFSGRATRSEYWYWALFQYLLLGPLYVLTLVLATDSQNSEYPDTIVGISVVMFVFIALVALAFLIPGIAVSVRRLHDTNRSGSYYFLSLIPYVGGIILLVFMLQKSKSGENAFG